MRIGPNAIAFAIVLTGLADSSARAETPLAHCANEVHGQYRPGEHRWYWYGAVGSAQDQRFYDCIDRFVKEQPSRPAASSHRLTARHRVAHAAKPTHFEEVRADKSALSGSESRIAAMNYVNMDCSSGPLPEVRIVTPPGSGELRMESIKYAVSRGAKNARAHCNGKIVDAVAVFYKSKADYAGSDEVILEVDFRAGTVKRFVYAIDVR
jgi:hypothetical protein